MPLDILGRSLDNLGDFPYKNPKEVRFGKPALFVRGTKSTYVPDELLPLIGEFFPRFRLVDIDAGHWLISEQPEAFRQGERERSSRPGVTLTHHFHSCCRISAASRVKSRHRVEESYQYVTPGR